MKKFRLRNNATVIIVILLLVNLKAILNSVRSMCNWFATSLDGLNNFSEGAQTAIAFTSILMVIVMIYKFIQK